ncbi:MAG: TonB-dependent siderophore receptor [Aquabacterium sp.]
MAAGVGLSLLASAALAQTVPAAPKPSASAPAVDAAVQPADAVSRQLPTVTIKDKLDKRPPAKQTYQAVTTTIGKGKQALRDIPQSVTVVTEKLMDDRNQDTVKEALKNTAGITFMAAEGGEEDIRLRGYSLASTGDIFADGIRDSAFYERDTFNLDRLEVLRGSASMLFGRGSTGGVVNQVSKQAYLDNHNEAEVTVGNGGYVRATTDLNVQTGEQAAVRLNAMYTGASDNGLGVKTNKRGVAGTARWGIGTRDEYSASLYHLNNHNGVNYGIPWVPASQATDGDRLLHVKPNAYYGLDTDYNDTSATIGTLSHTHKFDTNEGELKTVVRKAHYDRDLRAGAVRYQPTNANSPTTCQATGGAVYGPITDATRLCRGNNFKIQDMDSVFVQSDYSGKFNWFGLKNSVLTGVDFAHERLDSFTASTTGITKPLTNVGDTDGSGSVNEDARNITPLRKFKARALGIYGQDMMELSPQWKLVGGLRVDYFKGEYWSTPATMRGRSDVLLSKRAGILYQPTALHSFHFSYGTSFNTAGDTYQYEDDHAARTPAESSGNLELGAKIDSESGDLSTRFTLFHSTKYHERNRDSDSAADAPLLSGKRHAAGLEMDITGTLTDAWEVFGSYAWTPIARIDEGAPGTTPNVGEGSGTRPSLTPKHSATLWSTYRLAPQWRIGGGINYRSSQTPNRNPAGLVAPGFTSFDAMVEYSLTKTKLKLNVTNLTNKLYADMLYSGHYIPGAARSIQLSMTTQF